MDLMMSYQKEVWNRSRRKEDKMKYNKLFDGLYIGIVRDLCNTYNKDTKEILFSLSILFFTGRADENGNSLPYEVSVAIGENDYTNYEIGNYILMEIEDDTIKKWKLFREGDVFQKW